MKIKRILWAREPNPEPEWACGKNITREENPYIELLMAVNINAVIKQIIALCRPFSLPLPLPLSISLRRHTAYVE